MNRLGIVALSLISLIQAAQSKESEYAKYPFGLLTSGYGIVTEDDLAYDATYREISSYDPNEPLGSLHWQCFPINEVKATYDSWLGADGMGASNKIYSMCSPEIQVRHAGELQLYVDRRAHQVDSCLDFINKWKRVTENQETVCLNGDGGGYHKDDKDGKYKLWTWKKFKTKKGCHSYFYGYCNTKGCAKGRCHRS